MIRFENDCCDCAVAAYPCRGADCPNRHVPHIYCDNCGEEVYDEELWDDGSGVYICIACLRKKLEQAGVDTEEEDFEYEDYANPVSIESLIEEARG